MKLWLILISVFLLFFSPFVKAQTLSEDCDCGHNPYVEYQLSEDLEIDENPWRVTSVQHFDVDLWQEEEPAVCVVQLELIQANESVLYKDFQDVPDNDQELLWNGRWVLMSEFAKQMDASSCDIDGTQS